MKHDCRINQVTRWLLLMLVGAGSGLAVAQQLPAGIEVVYRSEMPTQAPSDELTLIHGLLSFEHGTRFPAHLHGGPGLYTLVEGSVDVQGANGKRDFGAGESYVQELGEVLAAANVSQDVARMAVAFVLAPGAQLTTFESGGAAAGDGGAGAAESLPAPDMVHSLDMQVPAPGARLLVVQLVGELPPGASTGLHSYPGPYLATVLAGEVAIGGRGGSGSFVRHEGWSMPAGESHSLVNDGDLPARFVATFLLQGSG